MEKTKRMHELFKEYRSAIHSHLLQYLKEKETNFSSINRWGEDVARRLKNFVTRGKLIRGSLTLLVGEMCGYPINSDLVSIASALELIHSSLLIHDDIMDRDTLRRGEETIFYQYQKLADSQNQDALHFGESLGICAGDIGFYLAIEMLLEADIAPKWLVRILTLIAHELSFVGIAQMHDMYLGQVNILPEEEEILKLYRYKTARYSFLLPFEIGATVAKCEKQLTDGLMAFGETLGILFQIKDDELGLFGTQANTGKPVGSDLIEGKKTLYLKYILMMAGDTDKKTIETMMQKKTNLTVETMRTLHDIAIRSGAQAKIDQIIDMLKTKCITTIDTMAIDDPFKKVLNELVEFVTSRTN